MRGMFRAAVLALGLTLAVPAAGGMMDRGDGVHTESWFVNQSFMELKDELATAREAGKGFVLIWEQPGCSACQRLHEVNFQDKKLIDYIGGKFNVMVMNMFGEVEVTDFDGEVMPEKDLAFKHRVNFTPTTIFFDETGKEVFRLPGYFKPFYYLAGFVFAVEKGYADESVRGMFPRWMQVKGAKAREVYGSDGS